MYLQIMLTEKEICRRFHRNSEIKGKKCVIYKQEEPKVNNDYTLLFNNTRITKLIKQLHPDLTGISIDATKFLDEITYDVYKRLQNSGTFPELIIQLRSFPKYIGEHSLEIINRRVNLEDNIVNIVNYLLTEIIQLTGYYTLESDRTIISYRDVNYVIVKDDELYHIFKQNVIPAYYFNDTYSIDEYISFLHAFLYENYSKNNCGLDIEDYLTRLLQLVNANTSYKQFTDTLMSNPVC